MAANIWITEHPELAATTNGAVPLVAMPPLAVQEIAVGVSSAASAPFGPNTKFIRIAVGSAAACVRFGPPASIGAAVTTDMRLDIYEDPIFRVNPGDEMAVIASAE